MDRGKTQDMAYYLFVDAIMNNQPIKIFNNGEMKRDFTYIEDIVSGLTEVIEKILIQRRLYCRYGNTKESLQDFATTIEEIIGKKA